MEGIGNGGTDLFPVTKGGHPGPVDREPGDQSRDVREPNEPAVGVLLGVKADRGQLVFGREHQRLRSSDPKPDGRGPIFLGRAEREMKSEGIEVDLEEKLTLPVIGREGPEEFQGGGLGPKAGDGGRSEARAVQGLFDGRPFSGMNDAIDIAEGPEPRIRVDGQGQPGPFGQDRSGAGPAEGFEERFEKGEATGRPADVPQVDCFEPVGGRRGEIFEVLVKERARSFSIGPGLEPGPVRPFLEEAEGLLRLGRGRVETRAEEKEPGCAFRAYFLILKGEVSSSSTVASVALPATTEAIPRGRRKKGGTPLLQMT